MFYVKCQIPRLMDLPDFFVVPASARLIHYADDAFTIFFDAKSSRERNLCSKDIPTQNLEL